MQHWDRLHAFAVIFCDAFAAPFNAHADTIRLIVNERRKRSNTHAINIAGGAAE
jgi:hypothetical protein